MPKAPDIQIVRSRQEFGALEDDWSRLAEAAGADVYLSFDWFYAVLRLAQDAPEHLYIITVRSDGELVGVLPGAIVERKLRVFTHRSLELIGNIYSPLRGCLVKPEHKNNVAGALVDFLLHARPNDWAILNFEGLSEGDPSMAEIARLLREAGIGARSIPQFRNVVTDLSGFADSAAYFKSLSKNLRQTIRTGINRMNHEGDLDAALILNKDQDIDGSMDDYYAIYSESWKRKERDPEFHHRLAGYLATKDRLRLFLLYFKKTEEGETGAERQHRVPSYDFLVQPGRGAPADYRPVAACYFIVHGKTAYYLKTAFREEHRKHSVGNVLFWFATKYLLDVDGVTLIDHQKGDEPYKLRWGEVRETRVQYLAANPRSAKARLELWAEHQVVPKLRRVRNWLRRRRTSPQEQD